MLSALSWINRDHIRSVPLRCKISEEEARKIIEEHPSFIAASTRDMIKTAISSDENFSNSESEENINVDEMDTIADDLNENDEYIVRKYNLDDYPEESMGLLSIDDKNGHPTRADFEKIFSDMNSLSLLSPREDPYLTNPPKSRNDSDDFDDYFDEEEDMDDLTIRPTDFVLVAARCPEDGDIAQLEYYIYEEAEDNIYVHHDIMLPTFPLCIEWSDYPTNASSTYGNLVAVGSFDTTVEIWDLDIIDPVYPHVILGGDGSADNSCASKHKSKEKASKRKKKDPHFHTGSVICLSWNTITKNFIASGSSDTTIKLWDLNAPGKALRSFSESHTDKVSSLQFSPMNPPVIASTSFDKTVKILDMRDPSSLIAIPLENDGEIVRWNPFDGNLLTVADEGGLLYFLDIRLTNRMIGTKSAHTKPISSLDYHPILPNVLLTTSFDKHLKIWDLAQIGTPSCVFDKKYGAGKLITGSFCKNSPFLIAYTGIDSQDPRILNLSKRSSFKSDEIYDHLKDLFSQRLQSIVQN